MPPSPLIVGGRPDAAVHRLAFLLAEHPHVLLGFDRYARSTRFLDPYHLVARRVVEPLPQEASVRGRKLYDRLKDRAESAHLAYTGDAMPGYAYLLDELNERLGNPRFVVVLGPPPPRADSIALDDWHAAVRVALASEQRPYSERVLILAWEQCVAVPERALAALLGFLELPGSPRLTAEWGQLTAALSGEPDSSAPEALATADLELDGWRRQRAEEDRERFAEARRPADLDDPALTADELQLRDAERAELLQELEGDEDWPDELRRLRQRFRDDAAAIAQRGERLRRQWLTTARGLPNPAFRVVVVNPYGRADNLAKHRLDRLARHLELLVGVRTLAGSPGNPTSIEPAGAEEADVIVCPAAERLLIERVRALAGDSRRLLLVLDATAGIEVVADNADCEVIASTASLARAARGVGARAVHIPFGITAELPRGLPATESRGFTIAAEARVEHGIKELEAVLVTIREARPDAEIVVFGDTPADGATEFRLYPAISALGEILGRAAVFVSAAREDAVGASGALALSAGCALASTATEGAGEYAIPESTALLTPVGDSAALAHSVITLLDDPALRTRIAEEGRRYVKRVFPSWLEVGRRVALLLTEAP